MKEQLLEFLIEKGHGEQPIGYKLLDDIVLFIEQNSNNLPNEEASNISENEHDGKLCDYFNKCNASFKDKTSCSEPAFQCYDT